MERKQKRQLKGEGRKSEGWLDKVYSVVLNSGWVIRANVSNIRSSNLFSLLSQCYVSRLSNYKRYLTLPN